MTIALSHLPETHIEPSSDKPDGGIVSTVCENLVFLRAFFGGKLFDSKLFDRMMRRWNAIFFPMQYGYGMMRLNFPTSRLVGWLDSRE
jgi:hypothetical protein